MKDSFVECSNLGWQFIFFQGWNYILLSFKVSVEKTAVTLMGLPLYVTWCFSLAAFSILSLFCISYVLSIK
jgi:hypothetical protein